MQLQFIFSFKPSYNSCLKGEACHTVQSSINSNILEVERDWLNLKIGPTLALHLALHQGQGADPWPCSKPLTRASVKPPWPCYKSSTRARVSHPDPALTLNQGQREATLSPVISPPSGPGCRPLPCYKPSNRVRSKHPGPR